jgi:hypothetical protein
MKLIFDKFESQGTKSLETITTILAKNFMKKNNKIITQYILSVDILLNISNIFENFKYGLDSIFDSIKLKKHQSIFNFPKQLTIGLLRFIGFFVYGFSSSIGKFFVSLKNLTYFYYGSTLKIKINQEITEEEMKKKWFIYNAMTPESKAMFNNRYIEYKKLFTFMRYSTRYGKYNIYLFYI